VTHLPGRRKLLLCCRSAVSSPNCDINVMRLVSIGEVLWDVIGEKEYLGGAPFNLCAHAVRLGHHPVFVSAVGFDDRGERALQTIKGQGIDTRYISQTYRAATGTSEIVLDEEGKATHRLRRPAAYDFVSLNDQQRSELTNTQPDWVCFGTLLQMELSPHSLTCRLLDEHMAAKKFYDVNLRPNCWTPDLVEELLHRATTVKLNEEEVDALAGIFECPKGPHVRFAEIAAKRFGLDLVCITRGSQGCFIWRNGQQVESPGFKVAVADTVGAGDAFSAALLHGLHEGWPIEEIGIFANRVGALVASRDGAAPAWTLEEALALHAE
jgi:fructokinase